MVCCWYMLITDMSQNTMSWPPAPSDHCKDNGQTDPGRASEALLQLFSSVGLGQTCDYEPVRIMGILWKRFINNYSQSGVTFFFKFHFGHVFAWTYESKTGICYICLIEVYLYIWIIYIYIYSIHYKLHSELRVTHTLSQNLWKRKTAAGFGALWSNG